MGNDELLIGWKEIAAFFKCSERKARSLKPLLHQSGTIFYMHLGKPPRKRVCAFPLRLRNWATIMGSRDYTF